MRGGPFCVLRKRHFHKKQDKIPPKTAYPAGIAFRALFCIAPHPALWYTYACDLMPGMVCRATREETNDENRI